MQSRKTTFATRAPWSEQRRLWRRRKRRSEGWLTREAQSEKDVTKAQPRQRCSSAYGASLLFATARPVSRICPEAVVRTARIIFRAFSPCLDRDIGAPLIQIKEGECFTRKI